MTRMAVISSLLSERRAAAVPSTPATAGISRRMVGVKVRPTLHRLLWRAQTLGGTQHLHSIIQTLTVCQPRCPALHHAPTAPPSRGNGAVSSADDTPTCEPTDGGPSAAQPNGDWWDDKPAEADDDEEEFERDNDENNPPWLRSRKKRCRSTACEKSSRKRGMKCRRLSSPPPSDEEPQTGEKSDCCHYMPSTTHHISKLRLASSHLTGLVGDTSDDGKMESAGGRSRMAIIYEQQCWEGEIIDERDMKQGRGRPRKQYLVRWKPSWVDGGRLTAPGLVHNWRETKASRGGR